MAAREPEAPTLIVGRPALTYEGPAPASPADADLAWVFEEANRALAGQGRGLSWDGRLAHSARSLLSLRDLEGITGAALVFALQASGAVEPHGRVLAARVARAPSSRWRSRLAGRLIGAVTSGGYTRIGGAVEPNPRGRLRVVLVLLRSHLRLLPLPRRPSEDTSVLLRGALEPGYGAARVAITAPDGTAHAPRLASATDGSFHAVVPLGSGAGIYQVEILGNGPGGPEVLANFPLFVGVALPDRLLLGRGSPPGSTDPHEAARGLWDRLQRARQQAGVSPLAWHSALGEVARAHALDMCRRQEVRHHSPESGTASDRVIKARIGATWVGENVGRVATVEEADRAMTQSPGHRATRLRADATHGAVGVCVVRRRAGVDLYVTELFVRLGRPAP